MPAPNDAPDHFSWRLDELRIHPQARFRPEDCQRLLRAIAERGGDTIWDAAGVCVSLEDFFEGNPDKSNFAANEEPPPPFDTIESWYRHLRELRDQPGITDVLVQISQIEPHGEKLLCFWPYSDVIWVEGSLDLEDLSQRLAPLRPTSIDIRPDLTPPHPPAQGNTFYWVWWD